MKLRKDNFIRIFQFHWRSFCLRRESLSSIVSGMEDNVSHTDIHTALTEIRGMKAALTEVEKYLEEHHHSKK
ncbi:hypothetical protein [Vibrio barjaei]|uniref:hypothetical protein n=1 Tax=Vibrio barjaei TaxID=1676683 RepID=UPI0022839B47|nr:hypothetical protein [Vibrio barjaei]MCY9872969.1 hypothetical protein [Vibrio barjaei]